ncbi:DMT family transporter [Parapedobacter deserti]|uniref:DMT family transporter n=1 Tax=Parapedobacter deserti TaxID=1912957 RepID=A0ABV7JII5_9SPHI
MNQYLITAIALFGGICLAVQAAFSSQLGVLLKRPILASIATYSSGALVAIVFVMLFAREAVSLHAAKQVPWYLWFIGGLFSVVGITLYYFAIPRIGMGKMMAFGLCGQLLFSVIAGHFGWLGLPVEPMTIKRMIGVVAMSLGIFFVVSN